MFESRTVFVVGAGASQEAGLPIGAELTKKIASLLSLHVDVGRVTKCDYQIYEVLKQKVQTESEVWAGNQLIASARHIGEAMEMATSIDTFLESFSHDRERMLLGKLGIAKAILTAERASKLAPAKDGYTPFSIRNVTDTWYVSLAQQLFSGVSAKKPEIAFDNVSFIVFNYDRCIQVFLVRALEIYFQLPRARAEEIVKDVTILHPYGSLGSVFPDSKGSVPFGAETFDLASISERIDTFSETVRDAALLSSIRSEINQADTIVFLGFAFHGQNIEVLDDVNKSMSIDRRSARVLATTFGLSQSDTSIVRSIIANLVWGQPPSGYIDQAIHTFNGTCHSFFGEYWRSITASPALPDY